jgi:hypothetical protein
MDTLGGLVLGAIIIIAIGIMKVFMMAIDCCMTTRIRIEYVPI